MKQSDIIRIRCFSRPGLHSPRRDDASTIGSTLKSVIRGHMQPSMKIHCADNDELSQMPNDKREKDKHNKENPREIAVGKSNTYSSRIKANTVFTTNERPLTAHEYDSNQPTIHIPNSSIDPSTDIPYLYNASRRVNRKTKGAHHKHNTENPSEITTETSSTYSRRTELGAAFTTHVHQSATREYDSELPSIRVPNSSYGPSTGNASQYDTYREKKGDNRRYLGFYWCTCTPFYAILSIICFLLIGFAIAGLIVALVVQPNSSKTTTVSATTLSYFISNANMVTNGDGETGSCAINSEVVSPPGWNYNGNITQVYYNDSILIYGAPAFYGPGAATTDRGNCLLYGQATIIASMWQTINLTNYADSALIDTGTVKFNLSAWLGGVSNQNDSATVFLSFTDQANQTIGSMTSIGPVLDTDRGGLTVLIFRQTSGLVPVGARSTSLLVTFAWARGGYNNGRPGLQSPIRDDASTISSTLKSGIHEHKQPSMKIHCADNDELSQIPNHKREKDKHNKEKPSEIAVEKSNAYSSKIKASGTFTTGEHQLTVHEYDSNPPKIHIPKSSMDPSTDITSAHNAARRVSRQKKDDHHKHNIENPSEIAVENSNTYSIGTKASGAFTTDERPLTAHECDSDLPTIHIPNSSIDPSTDIPYLYNASRRVNR
ncbi:unnamed protein product, partial [Rotaria socialis]